MKKIVLLLCLLTGLQPVWASSEIHFEQSAWTAVLAKAQASNKLVFFDAFTAWCGPCKWMAKNAFTDPAVAEFFNAHFVNVTVDMEKGEGIALAEQYQIAAYPSLLFLDGKGKVVHMVVGARSAVDLLQLGNDVVDGKTANVFDLKAQYDAGERKPEFLRTYILELSRAFMDFEAPLMDYQPSMRGEALLEPGNWELFNLLFQRHDTEFATFFFLNRARFETKFGRDIVQNKALGLYEFALRSFCASKDKARFKRLKQEMALADLDSTELALLQVDLIWHETLQEWKQYAKTVDKLAKAGRNDANRLNLAAWTIHTSTDNKALLKQALAWATTAVAQEKTAVNLDTQALLLAKLGRKTEAIAAAKASIALGKAMGEDVSDTERSLQEWER